MNGIGWQNADGIRVEKHITNKSTNATQSHYYDYNGTQLVSERWDGHTIWYLHDESGSPIGLTYDGAEYYYLKNLQGDITGIVDANGTLVTEYTYDVWGKVLSVTGTMADTIGTINPIRYRGYYYDTETGLYYLNSRYYDPEIGRFINADKQLNAQSGMLGYNLFAYCENNPANKADPTGHFGIGTLIGAAIGGLIGGLNGAITAACKGKSVGAGFVTGALTGAIIGGVCGAVADAVSTGGLSLLAGAAISVGVCGIVAAGGNAANQYWNYRIEKKSQTNNGNKQSSSTRNNNKTPRSSNGKLASECDSFADYVDVQSIAVSGVTAAVFAPIGLGANCIVNSAFIGLETGGINITAQVIANFAMGGNISILQGIIDLF